MNKAVLKEMGVKAEVRLTELMNCSNGMFCLVRALTIGSFYFCLFNQISKMLLHAYCKTIFHVYCKVCIVCQTSLSDLK